MSACGVYLDLPMTDKADLYQEAMKFAEEKSGIICADLGRKGVETVGAGGVQALSAAPAQNDGRKCYLCGHPASAHPMEPDPRGGMRRGDCPQEASPKVAPAIEWPKARDVGRIGDMSPSAHLRVGLDSDNDVYVSVWDEHGGGSVEFCNGGGGGGQSSRTRLALIALMVAMEADNAEKPARDWWATRTAMAAQGDR